MILLQECWEDKYIHFYGMLSSDSYGGHISLGVVQRRCSVFIMTK